MTLIIDYLCNGFLPSASEAWQRSIEAQGLSLKIRQNPDDGFCDPATLVERMDALGISAVQIVMSDEQHHHGAFNFSDVTARYDEVSDLVRSYPSRFYGLWCFDANGGIAGVERAREVLRNDWVVGLYNHVHSWDRPFDHADFYPYYMLASELDIPVVMQAGTSGGLVPSECGHPIGVDRPAIYFPTVRFVLSHTGWPWVDEAIAMALKFPNVFLGTAAYPARHWSSSLVEFLRGPGRTKTLFGTNFPTVGHRNALEQVSELDLTDQTREDYLGGTARRVFSRLPC
ncbi:MAG: amidohydrolase family protein [Actinobacteria bacterium]|nr:amidohydrolase family protein [Actinomycetota bacterium]